MRVPVHSTHVPSEKACAASSAPTSGCAFPSGSPYVIALPTAAKTSIADSSASARSAFRILFPSLFDPLTSAVRGSLARERPEVYVAHRPVADPLVDAVRRRVREVGVEEAEAQAAPEQPFRQHRGERAAVAAAAALRRRVDRADADPVRRAAPEPGHAHGLALVLPEHETRVGVLVAVLDELLVGLGRRCV